MALTGGFGGKGTHQVGLLDQAWINEPRENGIDAHEKLLGPAEITLPVIALDGGDDAGGDAFRLVLVHLQGIRHAGDRAAVEGGLGKARGYVRDADAASRQLASQRFGEAAQRKLAGRIGGEPGKADRAENGTQIDDLSFSSLEQERQNGNDHGDRRDGVDVEQCRCVGGAFLGKKSEVLHPGAVDQDIDRPGLLDRILNQAGRLARNGEIADERQDLASRGPELGGERLQLFAIAIDQDQRSAALGKLAGDGAADAAAGAGDQNRAAGNFHGVSSISMLRRTLPYRRKNVCALLTTASRSFGVSRRLTSRSKSPMCSTSSAPWLLR